MTGAELITKERTRQIEEEGWTDEHDRQHRKGELASAATSYLLDWLLRVNPSLAWLRHIQIVDRFWKWDWKWWKPTPLDPIRQLVKAGALIAAEIDWLEANREERNDDHT